MEVEGSGGGPQLLECFPCTSSQQLVNRTCIDAEAPTNESTNTEAPTDESTDTEAPTDESTDTEAPTDESTDTEAPTDESIDTEASTEGTQGIYIYVCEV